MKLQGKSLIAVLFASAALTSAVQAKPISTTSPEREKARCHAEVGVCDGAARDDYNRCQSAGQSHCSENYYEDINSCTSDFNRCMGSISASKGGIAAAPGIGASAGVAK